MRNSLDLHIESESRSGSGSGQLPDLDPEEEAASLRLLKSLAEALSPHATSAERLSAGAAPSPPSCPTAPAGDLSGHPGEATASFISVNLQTTNAPRGGSTTLLTPSRDDVPLRQQSHSRGDCGPIAAAFSDRFPAYGVGLIDRLMLLEDKVGVEGCNK